MLQPEHTGYSRYRVKKEDRMTIGGLAKETGVRVVTVRYYEHVGVLPAVKRTSGNYRSYGADHVRRLRFVRRCRDLGFSLEQVRDLLRLSAENGASCAEVCGIAVRQRNAVEDKIADLKRLASELRRITESCNGRRTMADCRIIEALSS
jgi:DNA-binding transcriptional MerR regulator